MFTSTALLSLILATASSVIDASPLSRDSDLDGRGITIPFAMKVSTPGTQTIVEKDRARIQAIRQAAQLGKRDHAAKSVSIANGIVSYTVSIGVGEPASIYKLAIDSGSSNTWLGARPGRPYKVTGTSKKTGNSVSIAYGSGMMDGEEWYDTVVLSPHLKIRNQSIGVANTSNAVLNGADGYFGIGLIDLTEGTVSNTHKVPTITNNLRSQGKILWEAVAIFFAPTAEYDNKGELTFGAVDHSKNTSPFHYVPLSTNSPPSRFWAIEGSISYGGSTILSESTGMVDTGIGLILLASDIFEQYQSATGAVEDSATGLLKISSSQYSALKTLTFTIGGKPFDLTPNAQIWPRSFNTLVRGDQDSIYLAISSGGKPSGAGLNFVLSYPFLQRFYTVLDTTNRRVGFASTAYTQSMTN